MTQENREQLIREIDTTLNDIRPHLQVDGGDVEIVDVTDDLIVKVKWVGNCKNCSMSMMTMKAGIEKTIRSRFPHLKEVEAVNGRETS